MKQRTSTAIAKANRIFLLLVTISPVLHTGICLVSCNNAMCKAALVVATTYAFEDACVL